MRLDAAAEAWGTVGVVLEAPSVGVSWADLGQVSLAGMPAGSFKRKMFTVPEQVRQAIRTAADLDPQRTYYLYIQPTFASGLSPGELEKGECTELKVRKERLGSFQALAPIRGVSGTLLVHFQKDSSRSDGASLAMEGADDNTFKFEPSAGAVAYRLQMFAAGKERVRIYDQTRKVGHCGIGTVNAAGHEDGVLRWWTSSAGEHDADCSAGEMDGELRLEDVARGGDISWRVFALDADGGSREAWHSGDDQPVAGSSVENRYFNFSYTSLSPSLVIG